MSAAAFSGETGPSSGTQAGQFLFGAKGIDVAFSSPGNPEQQQRAMTLLPERGSVKPQHLRIRPVRCGSQSRVPLPLVFRSSAEMRPPRQGH